MSSSPEPQALRDTERWFTRRGLPMFVEDYSSVTDVWTRALPVLLVLFVLLLPTGSAALLGIEVDLDLERVDVEVDAGALAIEAVVLALLVVAYAVWNLAHRRRPFTRPERVGAGLLAAFVLLPTLLTGILARDWAEVLVTAVTALVLLALVYVVTRYALLALTWWALGWTVRRVGEVVRLTTRVLPLLLLVVTFLFLSTELWQVAGTMEVFVLWSSLAVFAVLGVGVILSRVGEETARMDTSADRAYVLEVAARTPLGGLAPTLPGLDATVPLARRQRWNVGLVLVVAQGVQAALVGVVVWAFFVIFGALAIELAVQQSWLGPLAQVDTVLVLGERHAITRPLLRVSTFLAGFAAFYVTVVATGDRVYREHFVDQIGHHLRESLAVRRAYLAARRHAGLPAPAPAAPSDVGRPGDGPPAPP